MSATTSSNFIQWSGLATWLGGGVYVANMALWHPISEPLLTGTALAVTTPLGHAVHHAPELPAYALLAIGLLGLSRRLAGHIGWLGQIGLYLNVIGFSLMTLGTLGIVIFEGVLQTPVNALETVHPLLLLPLLGSLLAGSAFLKNRVLVPEGAWLIIAGALLFVGFILTGIIDTGWGYWAGKGALTLFSAGWTWLGYVFWTETREPARSTTWATN